MTARITGIEYGAEDLPDYSGAACRKRVRLRVEWMHPDHQVGAFKVLCGTEQRNFDISDRYPSEYRLGALTEILLDRDGPIDAFGHSTTERRVPAPGLTGAADQRDGNAERWPIEWATVVSWERVKRLGVTTNWRRVTVRRADGSLATTGQSRVPSHVQHYVVPGAQVPAAINPTDASEAAIDWVALAFERAGADAAGHSTDPPPAESLAADGGAGATAALAAQLEATRATPLDTADAIEGITFEQHVKIDQFLQTFRVNKPERDDFAALEFGVAPGRYTEIAQQWQQRLAADERLREAYGDLCDTYQPLAMQAAQADKWTWHKRGDLGGRRPVRAAEGPDPRAGRGTMS